MNHDHAEIVRALNTLFADGDVYEVRCLEATTPSYKRSHNESGFFDDHSKAASAIATMQAVGIYVTMNGVRRDLLARAANRLKTGERNLSASDSHVERRRWLLVDVDAVRDSGISSTDAEKEIALKRIRTVFAFLRDRGWPDPVTCDSGNGYHLLYRIDEPPTDDHLVEHCLKALAARFDDAAVKIDTSVFNPSRICRLYGTVARKGDDLPERPHRQSKIIRQPDDVIVVDHAKLVALAATVPQPEVKAKSTYTGVSEFDLRNWIAEKLTVKLGDELPWNGGWKRQFEESPLCDHKKPDVFIGQRADGAIVAQCSHNSCAWNWHDLRERFDPKAERTTAPSSPAAKAKPVQNGNIRRTTMNEAVRERISDYRRGPIPRVEFGIPKLDKMLGGGIPYGSFGVIGALTSHGKTAFALQVAHWATGVQKIPTTFVSVEMSLAELADRTIAFASAEPKEDWHKCLTQLERDTSAHFTDAATCTLVEGLCDLDEIEAEIVAQFAKGVRVAIVDYLQLIGGTSRDDTLSTMRRVSATFKRLAKEHNAIVLGLAQLNKRVETREPMVPKLSDLEYGSKLAHDADVVLLLLWPHKIDSSKPAEQYMVFIEKNRNGLSKVCVACRFNPPRQTISEERPARHDFGVFSGNNGRKDYA